MPSRRVYLETFGCQMNVLDSQLVRGQLQALGYGFTDDWKAADVVLYNTCSVREHAEQKVWSRVGLVGKWKQEHPHVLLGVIGCMAERDGEDLIRRHPQVDLLCGPGELDKLPMLIDNLARTQEQAILASVTREHDGAGDRGRSSGGFRARGLRGAQVALQGNTHRRSTTLAAAEDQLELLDLSRSFSPDEFQGAAYVRITRGCNKFCTYCVVPFTRGREVHRAPDAIVEECRKLAAAGVREVTLLGQTVNHYRYDHAAAVTVGGVAQPQVGAAVRGPEAHPLNGWASAAEVTTFAQLLARIHDEVPDLARLRFVTSFPRDFGDDILRVMADRPRICRYLHLPVQSGSDRVLRAMNRGYTVAEYLALLERARCFLPDVEVATDIICGFPGETEEDHAATAALLERGRFKNAFIFKYSSRPGTTAHDKLADDVPEAVKRRRNNELLAIQARSSAQVHEAYVGRTVEVFVESLSALERKNTSAADPSVELGWLRDRPAGTAQLTGRSGGDLIVCFEGDPALVGQIVPVTVTRAAPLTLFGELAASAAAVPGGVARA